MTIVTRRTCTVMMRIGEPFGLCGLHGKSVRGGRNGGRSVVALRRLGPGSDSSANGANDGICCRLEAGTESEGFQCLQNRAGGGVYPCM
jgi:hypothetical protein